MKKLLLVLSIPILLFSCGKTGKVNCSNSTVLAEGKGFRITLSDYRYVQSLLGSRARKFFSSHREDLLNRMINRRLVLIYVRESGLSKRYGIDKQMEEFKEDYLSRLYVSKLASKMAAKVTEKDIRKRFRELFPKRNPDNMTAYDRAFITNELKVKNYDRAIQKVYGEFRKGVRISGDTATYDGISVKLKKGLKPEERMEFAVKELSKKYFFKKALSEGLDRDITFKRTFNEMYEMRAKSVLLKELSKGIKVSDEEVRRYYEENREKFTIPERVKAVVFLSHSEKRAKEIERELGRKKWRDVARELGKFDLKPRTYVKGTKDPIGALLFMTKKNLLTVGISSDVFATVKVLERLPEKRVSFADALKYIRMKLSQEKERKRLKEKLEELRKRYNVKVKRQNLICL